jgi:hypothetical protein
MKQKEQVKIEKVRLKFSWLLISYKMQYSEKVAVK